MGRNMDNNTIIEFSTQQDAETGLAIVNQIASAWWQSQGYTVIDGELVGKNAATGQDEPEATKTKTWDIVKESPDGTFYFTSPATDARFVDWRSYLPKGVTMPEDKAFPTEWIPVDPS